MDLFVSTYTNKLDAKGRVSIPAPFRTVLQRERRDALFCHPALDSAAIEAGGDRLVAKLQRLLDHVGDYSDEHDDLSMAVFGDSEELKLDGDGRIALPPAIRDHAGIVDQVTFVGLGDRFQMWEPGRYSARREQNRSKLREHKKLLGAVGRGQGASEGARE